MEIVRRGKTFIKSKLPAGNDAVSLSHSSTPVISMQSDRCFEITRRDPSPDLEEENGEEHEQASFNSSYIEMYINTIYSVGIIPHRGIELESNQCTSILRKVIVSSLYYPRQDFCMCGSCGIHFSN